MGTMNISLPDSLRAYVDEQVTARGYGTSSEFLRDLIRHDRDREALRALLLEGAGSSPDAEVTPELVEGWRKRAGGTG